MRPGVTIKFVWATRILGLATKKKNLYFFNLSNKTINILIPFNFIFWFRMTPVCDAVMLSSRWQDLNNVFDNIDKVVNRKKYILFL